MKYTAKDATQVIPAGTYDATIKAYSEEKKDGSRMMTKAGDPMCMVRFEVYVGDQTRVLSDYFMAGKMLWRYKKLAQAIGQEDAFNSETFSAENHIGDALQVEIEVEESDEYGEQSKIKKFMPKRAGATAKTAAKRLTESSKQPMGDDDIPF